MACSQLYRQSKLGLSLVDALDQLVEEGKLPPQLALHILEQVCRKGLAAPRAPVLGSHRARGRLRIDDVTPASRPAASHAATAADSRFRRTASSPPSPLPALPHGSLMR